MRVPNDEEMNYFIQLARTYSNTASGPEWATYKKTKGMMTKRDEQTQFSLILSAFLYGFEMGMGPIEALYNLDYISGKYRLSVHAWTKVIRRECSTFKLYVLKDTLEEIKLKFTRDGKEWFEMGLSLEDCPARLYKNGTTKENWINYPQDQLWGQLMSRIGRRYFADLVGGRVYNEIEMGKAQMNNKEEFLKEIHKDELENQKELPSSDTSFIPEEIKKIALPPAKKKKSSKKKKELIDDDDLDDLLNSDEEIKKIDPPSTEKKIIDDDLLDLDEEEPKKKKKSKKKKSKPFLKPVEDDLLDLDEEEPKKKSVKKKTSKKKSSKKKKEEEPSVKEMFEDKEVKDFLEVLGNMIDEKKLAKVKKYLSDSISEFDDGNETWSEFVIEFYDTYLDTNDPDGFPTKDEVLDKLEE